MKLRVCFKLAISITLLAVILWQVGGIKDVGAVMSRADLKITILTLLVITLDRVLMTYKWIFLLRSQGQQLALFRGLKIYCSAAMWGFLLPTTLGADAIRAFITARSGLHGETIVASIIVERMVGFLASLVLGLMALGLLTWTVDLGERSATIWWGGVLLLLGATIAFAISFNESAFNLLYGKLLKDRADSKIVQRLKSLHETYLSYHLDKRRLTVFFGLTFVEQCFSFVVGWLTALALNVEIGIVFMAAVIPLTLLVSRLPISIDGIGVFEALFVLFMAMAGISAAEAVSISVAARVLQIVSSTPWWLAYIVENNRFSFRVPSG